MGRYAVENVKFKDLYENTRSCLKRTRLPPLFRVGDGIEFHLCNSQGLCFTSETSSCMKIQLMRLHHHAQVELKRIGQAMKTINEMTEDTVGNVPQ